MKRLETPKAGQTGMQNAVETVRNRRLMTMKEFGIAKADNRTRIQPGADNDSSLRWELERVEKQRSSAEGPVVRVRLPACSSFDK